MVKAHVEALVLFEDAMFGTERALTRCACSEGAAADGIWAKKQRR